MAERGEDGRHRRLRGVAGTETPASTAMRRSPRRRPSKLWFATAAGLALLGGAGGRRAAIRGLASLGLASAFANLVAKPLTTRRRPEREELEVLAAPPRADAALELLPLRSHRLGLRLRDRRRRASQPALSAPLRALATLVGYSRVHTGVHYPADVLAGAFIGVSAAELASACSARQHDIRLDAQFEIALMRCSGRRGPGGQRRPGQRTGAAADQRPDDRRRLRQPVRARTVPSSKRRGARSSRPCRGCSGSRRRGSARASRAGPASAARPGSSARTCSMKSSRPPGFSTRASLGERRRRVGDRAEHQRRDRGVEAGVLERQPFGRRFDHGRASAPELGQLRPQPLRHVRVGLDQGQAPRSPSG